MEQLLQSLMPEHWAVIVAALALLVSAVAFGWQAVTHFRDGGRVKVHLIPAVWASGHDFVVTNEISWLRKCLKRDLPGRLSGIHQRTRAVIPPASYELAKLVVENPSRYPVTLVKPGIVIKGGPIVRSRFVTPRIINPPRFGGSDVFHDLPYRLEPFDQVSFFFDYWGLIGDDRAALTQMGKSGALRVRGQVRVAGRRATRSPLRLRWVFRQNSWTSIASWTLMPPEALIFRALALREAMVSRNTSRLEASEDAAKYIAGKCESVPTEDRLSSLLAAASKAHDPSGAFGWVVASDEILAEMHSHANRLGAWPKDEFTHVDRLLAAV